MDNVVSIKSSIDEDLQRLFNDACPSIPDEVSDKVQLAVKHAQGSTSSGAFRSHYKLVCCFVVGACVFGAALVNGFSDRWNRAVASAAVYTVQAESVTEEAVLGAALPESVDGIQSWQRSKGAWAEYIARLERDPFYQYVVQEKTRFEARYPNEPAETEASR